LRGLAAGGALILYLVLFCLRTPNNLLDVFGSRSGRSGFYSFNFFLIAFFLSLLIPILVGGLSPFCIALMA